MNRIVLYNFSKISGLINNTDKLTLIFLFSSLNFWLITILTTKIVDLSAYDFLGIVSKLPLYFWLSLFLNIYVIVRTYKNENKYISLAAFILLVFILFGTYNIIEPNPRFSVSYFPSSMSKQIVEKGYVLYEFADPGYVYLYYAGFPIFTALFLEISNIDLISIIRYAPIFLMMIIITVVFLTVLKMSDNIKFTIGTLSIFTTYFWVEIVNLGPQFFTYTLLVIFIYFYISMLASLKEVKREYILILLLIFLSMSFSHVLTPLIILLFFLTNYLHNFFKKDFKINNAINYNFLLLFAIIYISIMTYIAINFFNYSVNKLIESFQSADVYYNSLTLNRELAGETITKSLVYAVRLFLVFVSFFVFVIFIIFIAKKPNFYVNKFYNFFLTFHISTIFLLPLTYGGEIIFRIILFGFISTSLFLTTIVLRYFNYKIMFLIVLFFAILHPVAYSGDEAFRLIPDSELVGASFFTKYTDTKSRYFYQDGANIIRFSDPYRKYSYIESLWFPPKKEFDLDGKFKYLITSKRSHEGLVYYIGYDPIISNIDLIEKNFIKNYTNARFDIYLRK